MKKFFDLLLENKVIRELLEDYGPQIKKAAVICLIGFVLFAGFSMIRGDGEDLAVESGGRSASGAAENAASSDAADSSGEGADAYISDGTIFVDIGGAVKTPMLAELPDGSRVDDAIKAAGGLRTEADMTNINRAEFLVDGQKIFIPSLMMDEDGNVIESTGIVSGISSNDVSASGKININTADSDQLQTLTGVGPATAQKILDYRQANGSFQSTEDLKNVSGIGDKTYEKLKDNITV